MDELKTSVRRQALVETLESIYRQYHQRAYVHPEAFSLSLSKPDLGM